MSNPTVAPREPFAGPGSPTPPDAFFEAPEAFEAYKKTCRSIEVQQRMLAGLDMDVASTIMLPQRWCADPRSAARPIMALAKAGRPTLRLRTAQARGVTTAVWRELEESGSPFLSRQAVGAAMRDRFQVDAGTEFTLGRLKHAYPRVGFTPARPVSREEAALAVRSCGLGLGHLPPHALQPYPLIAAPGERAVMVNPNSDNGFPVLEKWSNESTHEKVWALAVMVRNQIAAASRRPGGVEEWKRQAEQETPWLVALRGKAKADYYKAEKISQAKLRFYNALPRQIMLNMQVATQPLEALSRTILEEGHSGIGITLVRQGAHRLVSALDEQLRRDGHAFVHVGDDSWVAVRSGEKIVMFALDCSNFDLTQHGAVTCEVHKALRKELQRVDAAAADLWYAYMRERLVVTVGSLVRRWRHAGPSGMPLQSKVNDMLMDVLIRRVLQSGAQWGQEASVSAAIEKVGRDMGFEVRVEQYGCRAAESVVEYLQQEPFLFIGYYFHVRGTLVVPCSDLPRTMAQLPYPSLQWIKTDSEVAVMEAMRLGSIFLSSGIFPRQAGAAHAAWKLEVVRLLEAVIRNHGDSSHPKLRWAVGESPWGPDVFPSLSGLLNAVQNRNEAIWLEAERELPTTSQLVSPLAPLDGVSWADVAEEEELTEAAGKRLYIAPPGLFRAPASVVRTPAPTHPPAARNDGRPPPTAHWGPPKPPRERGESFSSTVRRPVRGRRLGKVLPLEEEEYLENDSDEWSADDRFSE